MPPLPPLTHHYAIPPTGRACTPSIPEVADPKSYLLWDPKSPDYAAGDIPPAWIPPATETMGGGIPESSSRRDPGGRDPGGRDLVSRDAFLKDTSKVVPRSRDPLWAAFDVERALKLIDGV